MAQAVPLASPGFLHTELPENPLCLITDDGTALVPVLAEALRGNGWTPAILSFSGISAFVNKKRKPFAKGTAFIELTSSTETELQSSLKSFSEKHGNIGGFIHLHPVSKTSSESNLEDGTNVFLKQAFLSAKNICSSLQEAAESGKRRSHFLAVTRLDGELGMGTGGFNALSSGLSGLTKTAGVEWPDVFCRFVDLQPELKDETAANCILQELHDPDLRIKEVGYVGAGKSGTRRMTVQPGIIRNLTTAKAGKSLTKKSVFLVSGGARGVTAECVVKLAETKPCNFILLGRSPLEDEPEWAKSVGEDKAKLKQAAMQVLVEKGEKPTPQKVNQIVGNVEAGRAIRKNLERIQNAGGQAEYVSADVTDAKNMKAAIAPAVKKFGAVTAVIHGAGVLADKLIEKKTAEDFDAVCSTKINGIDALLKSVDPEKLTHLLLFSSAAGFYGNAGQSDYAMGNETLNGVALLFKQNHPECHVTSFNWGPWEGGMVTPELKRLFEERNVEVISVEDGTRVFVEEVTSGGQLNPIVLIGNSMVVPNEPEKGFRKWKISRKINLESNPVFHDHAIGENPVLPSAHAMSWMVDACEQGLPGFKLSSCSNFKVLNGVKFDETLADQYTLALQEIKRENGNYADIEVKVSSQSESGNDGIKRPRFHYSTQVRLARQVPMTPLHDRIDLSNTHNLPGSSFYQDGTLFHGPKFQGIQQVLNIGEQGLTLECSLPAISSAEVRQFASQHLNPFAADLAFQAMLIWAWRFHQSGSLPLKTDTLEHFRKVPFETQFYLSMSVNKNSATALSANLFLHDEQGLMYARILGAEVTLSKSLNALFGKKSSKPGKSRIRN
ncbi:MAG TPA: SDR family NAD(P)-dependent oxidoreductase [Deltaproteobacteria bacterium]|nr:SDR family NAD(P)-dependent oxidoreductase [Deltaproteobacteria bacterium]